MRLLKMNFGLIRNNLSYLLTEAKEAWKESYRRTHPEYYRSYSSKDNTPNYAHHYRVNAKCDNTNTEFYFDLYTNEPGKIVYFTCDCCGDKSNFRIPTEMYSNLSIGYDHHLNIIKK